jgi:hypothetical protein
VDITSQLMTSCEPETADRSFVPLPADNKG